MDMKSFTPIFLTLLILGFSGTLLSCSSSGKQARDLYFFYFESCPSCDEYIMAQEYGETIKSLDKKRAWNGRSWNLITPEAAEQLKTTLQEKGLPDISRSLPLLIIGDEYINGYDAIGEKLKDLTSGNS